MPFRFKIKGGVESLAAFSALRRVAESGVVIRSDVEHEQSRKRYERHARVRIVPG